MKPSIIAITVSLLAAQSLAAQPSVEPIISDDEFEKSLPALDAPMETIADWQAAQDAIAPAPIIEGDIDAPLPPLSTFDAEALLDVAAGTDETPAAIRYDWRIDGIAGLNGSIGRFKGLSTLEDGDGKAANGAMVAARLTEDQVLLSSLLEGEGYYDATITVSTQPAEGTKRLTAILSVVPGPRYSLGSITFDAGAIIPPTLIADNFVPKTGDPIIAETILAAEANLAIVLPQNGYPFAAIGQRDILLDGVTVTGDYVLPVASGPRSRFGGIITQGDLAFGADHVGTISRFKAGDLYDSRKVDDLRDALVATGLFSTVSVEPQRGGVKNEDGTETAVLLVRQQAGPARTIAASAGYGTGQGIRIEGSWTHRNLFPPEGALIASALAGTQEQGAGATFRRSNAGRRDKTVEFGINALHSNFEAFEAYTGRLFGRIAYESTPIWQKRITYAYGFELIGTNEQDFDFRRGVRDRQTYYLAALPTQIGFDSSNSLLDPTRGFRVNAKFSPEIALGRGTQTYVRTVIEATYYQPFGQSFVVAGRARIGSIAGVSRDVLTPSRRFYGGGGGSVRGFGYQELGPKDPDNKPVGGLSTNEAAIEARYRFGNFGVVGFIDAGQVYPTTLPKFNAWRFGAGIGGRFYTNFGPLRLDVATPIGRKAGESRVSVYISIGQAF